MKKRSQLLDERVISANMAFKTPLGRCAEVVKPLEKVSWHITTIFNAGVISRVDEDGSIPAAKILEDEGKTPLNLG